MIKFSDFSTENALHDSAVGIFIKNMVQTDSLSAYATVIEAGNKVGSHYHHQGDEWYIILSGEGEIFTAEVNDDIALPPATVTFKAGSVFCIAANTAHQLYAHSRVELIFLCPAAHLTNDRTGYDDLFLPSH